MQPFTHLPILFGRKVRPEPKTEKYLQLVENEERVIQQAMDGDERAFRILFEAYQHPIFNFIFRMLGHAEDAADATQEVFFKVYKKFSTLRDAKYFSTWLFSIAKNEAITTARRSKSKPQRSVDEFKDKVVPGKMSTKETLDPEEMFLHEEFADIFQQVLMEIPEIYRVTFVLGVLEGLAYEEVAQILSCSIGNVKSRVFRARDHIAKRLEKEYAIKI